MKLSEEYYVTFDFVVLKVPNVASYHIVILRAFDYTLKLDEMDNMVTRLRYNWYWLIMHTQVSVSQKSEFDMKG